MRGSAKECLRIFRSVFGEKVFVGDVGGGRWTREVPVQVIGGVGSKDF
jgi:hypothetical protein